MWWNVGKTPDCSPEHAAGLGSWVHGLEWAGERACRYGERQTTGWGRAAWNSRWTAPPSQQVEPWLYIYYNKLSSALAPSLAFSPSDSWDTPCEDCWVGVRSYGPTIKRNSWVLLREVRVQAHGSLISVGILHGGHSWLSAHGFSLTALGFFPLSRGLLWLWGRPVGAKDKGIETWGGPPHKDRSLRGKYQVMIPALLKGESFGSGVHESQKLPLFNVLLCFQSVNIFWIEYLWQKSPQDFFVITSNLLVLIPVSCLWWPWWCWTFPEPKTPQKTVMLKKQPYLAFVFQGNG